MKRKTMSSTLTVLFMALAVVFLSTASLQAWDDLSMIAAGAIKLAPNVMILFDSSGSMNCPIEHSAYDPRIRYGGTFNINNSVLTPSGIYHYIDSTNSNTPVTLTLYVTNWGTASAQAYTWDTAGSTAVTVDLYRRRHRAKSSYRQVMFTTNYLRWLYFYATAAQRAEVNNFHRYGYWTGTTLTDLDRCQRITVAKKAMKEVVSQLWDEHDLDPLNDPAPRIGITTFSQDGSAIGGDCSTACHDNASENSLHGAIDAIDPTGGTPLAETMAEIWGYFRGMGKSPDITDDSKFRSLENLATLQINEGSFPITDWCQLNFCLVMTDGAPSADQSVDDLDSNTVFFWENLDPKADKAVRWGYNPDKLAQHPDLNYSGTAPISVKYYEEDGTLGGSGSYLLDDIADYMFTRDLYPDDYACVKNHAKFEQKLKNKQFVYTYTIGFAIEHPLLVSTATAGGGEAFTASNYEELVEAMLNVFAAIEEKVNAYAGFTAPKLTTLDSDYTGYISTFVNKANEAFWEGHLRAYKLNQETGGFYLDDTGAASVTHMIWDAGEKLSETSAASRNLWTWFEDSKKDVLAGTFTNAQLGAIDDAQREYIISVIRGDETNTTFFPNPADYPYKLTNGKPRRLGDIFHFQPQVVGQPLFWKTAFDVSYADFFETYKDRTKAVYAGANDGFLHCFDADSGKELWAFMPAVNLMNLKPLALNTEGKHLYFVDGQGTPIEIKINPTGTDHNAWITLFTFSLGMGGKAYYGMDITEPSSPEFLWELAVYPFGANINKTVLNFGDGTSEILSTKALIGPTMGKPTVGTLNVSGRAVQAVILGGGFQKDKATVNTEGKSIFILNAHTGELIKMFHYGASASNSSSTQVSPDLLFSIPATPRLVDFENDGIHDAVYIADVGGQIWKISLKNSNTANWTLDKIFDTNESFTGGISPQPFFITPTVGYDDAYNTWVFAGTGDRSNAYNLDNTGRFFAFRDDGKEGADGYLPSDLQDISHLFISTAKDDTDGDGWSDALEASSGTNEFDGDDHPDTEDVPKDMPQESMNVDTQGVYLDLPNGNGEKLFEPAPIYIDSRILFNTFLPPTTVEKTPCESTGEMRLYQFRINSLGSGNGQGPTIDAGTSIEARILGSGLFDSGQYNVYLGVGEIGSDKFLGGDDDGGNMKIGLSDIFGPMFWKEKRR
jgi:Tfp pilus tip-associated adhesin PilY1